MSQLEELLTEQQAEHEDLEKQMTMELTMAERAQAAAEQAQAAAEQALAAAQEAAQLERQEHSRALEAQRAAHEQSLAEARGAAAAPGEPTAGSCTSGEDAAAELQQRVQELEAQVRTLLANAHCCEQPRTLFGYLAPGAIVEGCPACRVSLLLQCSVTFCPAALQVRQLEARNASLVESERQTAAELSQRLIDIAAQGQRATDSQVDKELLASAVETVQASKTSMAVQATCAMGVGITRIWGTAQCVSVPHASGSLQLQAWMQTLAAACWTRPEHPG